MTRAKRHEAPSTTKTRASTSAFLRTRSDHAAETAEDYVEAVADLIDQRDACRVKDLAERFGVSHVTVIRIVQRLEKEGLLSTEPYKPIELTPRGRRLARHCRERHDIVYRFLLAIGVSERVAAHDSEGIEHHVSPQTLDRFRDFVREQDA
jgi:DtxR family manganese transport transcriptional regulator